MVRRRIEELRRQLDFHNHKYYVENAPEISDFDFDRMMRELQELEAAHPEFADPDSPTARVGSDISAEFATVKHRYPMLSLSNTYSLDELHEFLERIERECGPAEYVCELKFDGTAISLTYENGRLLRAVTRGDGVQGGGHGGLGILLGQRGFLGHGVDQFVLIHWVTPSCFSFRTGTPAGKFPRPLVWLFLI